MKTNFSRVDIMMYLKKQQMIRYFDLSSWNMDTYVDLNNYRGF